LFLGAAFNAIFASWDYAVKEMKKMNI